jgi:hypothetical protein
MKNEKNEKNECGRNVCGCEDVLMFHGIGGLCRVRYWIHGSDDPRMSCIGHFKVGQLRWQNTPHHHRTMVIDPSHFHMKMGVIDDKYIHRNFIVLRNTQVKWQVRSQSMPYQLIGFEAIPSLFLVTTCIAKNGTPIGCSSVL